MKLNLGCPKKCAGWECIDLRGDPPRDVYEFLEWAASNGLKAEEIYSKNLLEHLPDPGRFLKLCHQLGGELELITDNAEFMPFYAPFWLQHSGLGAHSQNAYALNHCNSLHLMVFTKMHMENLLKYAGYRNVRVERIYGGSRLLCLAS